jgi:hypothetical protein
VAIRTSEGIYLEVLQSAPVAGVPIEIDVYGGNNIATMLATLEGAQEPAFTDPFGDIGSGHFRIPVTDPKATGSIIRSGNYVKVKIAGVYRYAFFLENPRKVVASTEGEAGEYWDLGGRGNVAYLERGSVYPPGWPAATGTTHEYVGVTAAFILDELLAAAKARGAIPQLTWDFTASRDSDNAPWTDSLTMSIPAGMSLLDLWRQFVGMGYESEMTPDLRLRFWRDRSRDFSQTVIFRAGKHIRGEVTRDAQDAGLRTRMLVQGDGGRFFEVTDPVLEGDAYIGRREGYLSFTASTDPTTLQQVGDNALAEVSLASDALSVPLHHGIGNGDYEPYADYRNGDWVSLDIPGTYTLAKVRVRSLSVKAVAGGDYEVDADFNSVSLENIVRLKRIVDALGGGGSASGVVGSTGGSLSSSGGASSGSTGRVGAEQGDTPGYLYDKIDVLGPTKTLIGAVGARQVRITAEKGVANGYAELDSGILVPSARLGSGSADATKFLRGDRTWAVPASSGGGGSTLPLDTAPGTPHAKDDEFAGSSLDLTKWTAGAMAIAATEANGWLTLFPGVANKHAYFIRQIAPAGNFSIMAKVASTQPGQVADHRPGIFVARTASGLALVTGLGASGGGGFMWIEHGNYSESLDWGGYNGSWSGNQGAAHNGAAYWFRLRYASPTLYIAFSDNGVIWYEWASRAWSQPDRIGIVIENNSGNAVVTEGVVAEYFRVTEP